MRREAFEHHAESLGYSIYPDTRAGREGGYWSSHTQIMWDSWQAALAAQPVQADAPSDERIDHLWRAACEPDRPTRDMVRAFARAVLAETPYRADARNGQADALDAARVPVLLTDAAITEIFESEPRWHYPPIGATDRAFARDIERAVLTANGITGGASLAPQEQSK